MKFKSMKIAITDEAHLKAVCDVLELMGYKKSGWTPIDALVICASDNGYYSNYTRMDGFWDEYKTTLTDLLKMRDEMNRPKVRFNSDTFAHKH
ncbi:MAG: hypothetical protein [Caudoviricetes sp.]|nr:MAG: hypothetical protein [Caudoviricetes sp.]